MIHLTPRYKPVLKLSKPEIKSIHIWSDEAVESLQSCLEQTDWNVFINNCPDIEQLTDTVNSCIIFFEDLIIPRKKKGMSRLLIYSQRYNIIIQLFKFN